MTATTSHTPPAIQPSENDKAATNGKPSGSRDDGSRWLIPLIAGSTVSTLVSRGCSRDQEHAQVGAIRLPPAKQFLSQTEALEAVRSKKFVPVEEVSSPESMNSVILFKSVSGKETAILRGLTVGKERTDLLIELKALGHDVPTALISSSTTTAVAGQAGGQVTTSKPVYEPFILPTALVLVAYAGYRAFAKFGTAIGDALSKLASPPSSSDKSYTTNRPSERLNNYGGNKQVIAKVARLVNDIKKVMHGETKVKLPKGVLLSGDPGVGKSYLMKCVAGEADCPIIIVAAAALRSSPYAGSRTKGIEDLFEAARKARDEKTKELRSREGASGKEQAVALVVIDEMDSIARSRTTGPDNGENNDAINALLANMDGANSERNHHIVLFGATNYAEVIDPALRRPGRFNGELGIEPPANAADRLDVLEKLLPSVYAEYDCLPPSRESLKYLAEAVSTATPAELKGILEEAGRDTAEDVEVSLEELLAAYQTVKMGALRESTERDERQLLVSAHEFGHALVAYAFGLDPVIISMRPRGDSLGRVVPNLASLIEPPHTGNDLKRLMMVSAAGRGGELAFLGGTGEASNGVSSDFASISRYSKMFLESGMLDGSYSLGLRGKQDVELPIAQQLMLEAIGDTSVVEAARILRAIRAETFDKIAKDARGKEFFGPAAKEYLESHLSSDEVAALRDAARFALTDFSGSVRAQYKVLTTPSSNETGELLQAILTSREGVVLP